MAAESVAADEPNSDESLLIKAVSENNLQEVVNIVFTKRANVNCVDEHGMSPLQHACYKGNYQIAKFLIEQGADVNQNDHEHRYTGLMFAALGGHAAVLNLLLENGANISAINSVGRNASQMAAFVGQHLSVAIINNYIPRDLIEYYSKITGLEKEPRLSVRFIQPIHAFVRLVNVHPIKIVYFLKTNCSMFEEPKMISNVLQLLSEKLLLQTSNPREMLSLKLHYLNFMFVHVNQSFTQFLEKSATTKDNLSIKNNVNEGLNVLIKFWIKPNSKGFLETLERLLRQCIRQYAHQENSLFQQLVQTLSTVEIGDEPSALNILSQAIFGKGNDGENNCCVTCGELNPGKRCSNCKSVTYCDHICQKLHWPVHKHQCTQLIETVLEQEKKLSQETSKRSETNQNESECNKNNSNSLVVSKDAKINAS